MKFLSEVFLVTYSILYGIMLNSCIGLNLFPLGKLCVTNSRYSYSIIAKRFFLSLFIINIVPIIFFGFFLVKLQSNMQVFDLLPPLIQVIKIIGVFLSSFSVFIFYRFYIILVTQWRWLYDINYENFTHGQRETIQFIRNSSAIGHSISILTYIILVLFGVFVIFLI